MFEIRRLNFYFERFKKNGESLFRKTISLILILGAFNFVLSLPKSNLELLYGLIEKSIASISQKLPESVNKFKINYTSVDDFSNLENRVIYYLNQKELLYNETGEENPYRLNYTIENIDIDYSDTFKDGWFGDYKVERNIVMNISYNLSKGDQVIQNNIFQEAVTDTLKYSDIESVESYGIKFTQTEKPPEPFFQSFLEPVIAVGTLIVSIILLFTVRSK